MLSLKGKSALIIGTKRIGAVVTRRLAQEGVNLAVAYRRSMAEAQRLQSEVASQVEKAILVQGDMNLEADVRRMTSQAEEELGGLWFVINLASGYPRAPFDTLNGEAWDEAMADAKGAYLLAVYGARQMVNNTGDTKGHILMFSDWAAGETPYLDYLPYLTAKASIDFMTRAFAAELARHGILVNSIAPGPTMRPPETSEEEWARDVIASTPLKRESAADDIAETIVTLLKSETITGETIRVDAGRHLAGPGVEG